MVNRHIEETLYLVGMQVHGYQTVNAGGRKKIGNEFGCYAHAGFVFAVLTCSAKVRHYGYYGLCRCAFGCIYHEQQFKQIVCIGEGGLHQIYL